MRFLGVLAALVIGTPVFATTCCWDGVTLASDSQMTSGHKRLFTTHKLARSDKRQATMAGAGDVISLRKIRDHFMNSTEPMNKLKLPHSLDPQGGYQIFIVFDDGTALFYDDDLDSPVDIQPPFAFGSGADFALSALTLGKSAREAIELAKTLDIFTGGETRVLQAPKLDAPKPGK